MDTHTSLVYKKRRTLTWKSNEQKDDRRISIEELMEMEEVVITNECREDEDEQEEEEEEESIECLFPRIAGWKNVRSRRRVGEGERRERESRE